MKTFPVYLKQLSAAAIADAHNWVDGLTVKVYVLILVREHLPHTLFCVFAATILSPFLFNSYWKEVSAASKMEGKNLTERN